MQRRVEYTKSKGCDLNTSRNSRNNRGYQRAPADTSFSDGFYQKHHRSNLLQNLSLISGER